MIEEGARGRFGISNKELRMEGREGKISATAFVSSIVEPDQETGRLTFPPSRTQISAWHLLTTLLLNAIFVLVNAPPLGLPSVPFCLSLKRPILSGHTPGVSSLREEFWGGADKDWRTSRRTGSKEREAAKSRTGTRRRRWVGRLEGPLVMEGGWEEEEAAGEARSSAVEFGWFERGELVDAWGVESAVRVEEAGVAGGW
jgi:hypothetical protein